MPYYLEVTSFPYQTNNMNFGQNLYQWFLSNAQSLVLMAIVVIGIYLGFKREFSKLIGFLVVDLIAVGVYKNFTARKPVFHFFNEYGSMVCKRTYGYTCLCSVFICC